MNLISIKFLKYFIHTNADNLQFYGWSDKIKQWKVGINLVNMWHGWDNITLQGYSWVLILSWINI